MSPERGKPSLKDRNDIANANRGLVKSLDKCIFTDPVTDRVIWNNDIYSFVQGSCPPEANPYLWRQSSLCQKQGLYMVTPDIYQVRGFDISNMTIVCGPKGLIIIDPLISMECAKEALKLYRSYSEDYQPVKAVIFTHSHIDHYGGVEGVLPETPQLREDVEIYAPSGFFSHAVSENVYAGTAMTRRAVYMYGDQLEKDGGQQIGTGLGMTTSTGTATLVEATDYISEDGLRKVADVNIFFQLTPGTEAPAEMNFHFPDFKALCMAENVNHTMHNIQTLRGAMVRDARMWSKYIDDAIELFIDDTEVVFSSHHWPTWGTDQARKLMVLQRDMYAYLHDQTLRELNIGRIGIEIAEDFKLPFSLSEEWCNQGFYGSISHNVKAIYHRYMGWYDGNPAHLWEYPPVEAGKRYLHCMGGPEEVINYARQYEDENDLRFASTLLSHVIFGMARMDNEEVYTRAKISLERVFTKLGHGAECGPWRNIFLCGAAELTGPIMAPLGDTMGIATMMALELTQLMETMSIRLAPFPITPDTSVMTFNFFVTETKLTLPNIRLTLSNSALTSRYFDKDHPRPAMLTCTLTHDQLVKLVIGEIGIGDIPDKVGDSGLWTELMGYLTLPDPRFAIVTPERDDMLK